MPAGGPRKDARGRNCDMNANAEEVISVAQCANIFFRETKRLKFNVIYSRKEVLEKSGIQKNERLSEVIRFMLRPQTKLEIER